MLCATIEITPDELVEATRLLALDDGEPDSRMISTLMEWTAVFSDGIEVDLKVCNGEPPYSEACWIDTDGQELEFQDSDDNSLLGPWQFDHKDSGTTYLLTVVVKENG